MNEFEAQKQLEPYFNWFRECWAAGWDDYHKLIHHPDDDFRTRSVNIQNRAVIYAKKTHSSQPDVKLIDFYTRRLFKLGDLAICQFKKLENKCGQLLPKNSKNDTSDAFVEQQLILELGELPRLTIGYLPNQLYSEYTVHLLHTKNAKEINWYLDITASSAIKTNDLFQTENEQPDKQRVIPKRAAGNAGDQAAQG